MGIEFLILEQSKGELFPEDNQKIFKTTTIYEATPIKQPRKSKI